MKTGENSMGDMWRDVIVSTAKSPLEAGKFTLESIKGTLLLSKDFALSVSKIPGFIQLFTDIKSKYVKNLELSNETILKDIEMGQSLLARLRADIFGMNINHIRKTDNLSILNACMKYHDSIMLRKLVFTQIDIKNPKLDFSIADSLGNDALINATKSGYIYGITTILNYPDTLWNLLKSEYFSNKNAAIFNEDDNRDLFEEKMKAKMHQNCNFDINHQNNVGKTALMIAAESLLSQKLEIFIDAINKHKLIVNPDLIDEQGRTILHAVALNNNGSISKKLLEMNVNFNPDLTDKDGNTPIMLALMNKHFIAAKAFLKLKPNLNIENKNGESAIKLAKEAGFNLSGNNSKAEEFIGIFENKYEKLENNVIKFLPENIRKINPADTLNHILTKKVFRIFDESLSKTADKIGRIELMVSDIEMEIQRQLKIMSIRGEEYLALYKLYVNKNEIFVNSLENDTLESQVLVNLVDINYQRKNDLKNSLMLAIEKKDLSKIEWILERSSFGREIDFGLKDINGDTAFMHAAKNGFIKSIVALFGVNERYVKEMNVQIGNLDGLEKIASERKILDNRKELSRVVNIQNQEGKTALMVAIENNKVSFATELIEICRLNKVNINMELQDKSGETILHKAVKTKDYELVDELFSIRGFTKILDSRDNAGNYALLTAVRNNSYDIAKLLVQSGADKDLTPQEKNKLAELPKENKNQRLISRLLAPKNMPMERTM